MPPLIFRLISSAIAATLAMPTPAAYADAFAFGHIFFAILSFSTPFDTDAASLMSFPIFAVRH
jgi:hypothetical protein